MILKFGNNKINLMEDEELTPKGRDLLENHIKGLPVPQKLELAVRGNKEVRMILAKDGNKIVARAVIASPRIDDDELINFAQSPTVNEEILRYIADNNKMTGNQRVVVALCNNPRTPVGTALRFLPKLSIRELKSLSHNKNIPAAVSEHSRRVIRQKLS